MLPLPRGCCLSRLCLSSQIYNEVIRDLLSPSSGVLDLREDSRGSIQIAGIMEVSTSNAQEVRGTGAHGGKGAWASAATLARAHGAEPDTWPHAVSRLTGCRTVRSGQTSPIDHRSSPCAQAPSHAAPQPVPARLKSPTCSAVPAPPGTWQVPRRGSSAWLPPATCTQMGCSPPANPGEPIRGSVLEGSGTGSLGKTWVIQWPGLPWAEEGEGGTSVCHPPFRLDWLA